MPETTTTTDITDVNKSAEDIKAFISNMEGGIDEQLIVNYTRPMRKLKSLKAIIIHWTANTSRGADAQANRNYFNNLRPQHLPDGRVRKVYASAHYMVDDKEIIRCVPDDEVAYHVGARFYKPIGEKIRNHSRGDSPNNYTIGIEMCVNSDGDWDKTYQATVELTRFLMEKYSLSVHDLYRHYDITGKLCPQMMIEESDWQTFKDRVVEFKGGKVKEKVVQKGVVLVDGLNVRSGNSVRFPVVKQVNKGDEVTIYDEVGSWFRIGDNVWAHSNFVKISKKNRLGEVEAKRLNVRKGPGSEYDVVEVLNRGDDVTVYEEEGKWIRIGEGKWTHGDYVLVYDDKIGKVNYRYLNVRDQGSIESNVVGRLQKGDEVHILLTVDKWHYIGDDRWVHVDYIDIIGEAQSS